MANKLAHLVIEGNTYDIQDEELTSKFDNMTIELSLSNDYIISATLKDGNNTTLSTSTIDLPSENSLVSLDYDNTTNEIIGIYRDDTVDVPHRIRVKLDNLQEKLTAGQNISITNNTVSLLGLGEASNASFTGIATLDNNGKVPSSQLPSYDKAIEVVNNQVSVRYADKQWDISRDSDNKLYINGRFVKQVDNLDAYTDAPDGEIVEYTGTTNGHYTNGYFYKRIAGSSNIEYETITIPANTTYITYHFPDNTEETGYQVSSEIGESASWYYWRDPIVQSPDNGTLVSANWEIDGHLAKVGDQINVSNNIGYIDSIFWVFRFPFEYNSLVNDSTDYANLPTIPSGFNQGVRYISADTIDEAVSIYKAMCDAVNLPYSPYGYSETVTIGGLSVIINDKHYNVYYSGSTGGYGSSSAYQLLSNSGKRLFLLNSNQLVYNVASELREEYGEYSISNDTYYPSSYAPRFYNNYHYNPPTTATLGTTTESITMTIPILYDENGELIVEEIIQPSWQRIDVQPNVTKTSDLLNDSDFITHLVSNLTNYYTKSETDAAIGKGAILFQKNGSDITLTGSPTIVDNKTVFGANQTGTTICNIPVPTQTSELTNNGEGVQGYPFITKAANDLENYYTESEVNNLLSQLETNIDWKEAVNTYADIATTYPNPQDGWTVNVKDTDYTYRWDGTNWVAISANAIPQATTLVDGLMTTTMVTKLNGIEAGAEVNVQSDWNQSNTQADDYIKNKPVIPTITFRQWNTTE